MTIMSSMLKSLSKAVSPTSKKKEAATPAKASTSKPLKSSKASSAVLDAKMGPAAAPEKKKSSAEDEVNVLKDRLAKGHRLNDAELAQLELAAVARWNQLQREEDEEYEEAEAEADADHAQMGEKNGEEEEADNALRCDSTYSSSIKQSSNAAFIPCPKKGTTAWAASPTKSNEPTLQGSTLMVTRLPTGLSRNSLATSGMRGTTSGNLRWKYASTSSALFSSTELNPSGPKNGANKVAVKEQSGLGRAMSINAPRGQMCRPS
jgi:hypothetical protein